MTVRRLPAAPTPVKTAHRSELSPSALERFRPGLRAAAEDGDVVTIDILDMIGVDFFGEGVTAKTVAAKLLAAGGGDIVVVINSPGGDFFEGLAIYNLLRDYEGRVTVKIIGLAASAASVIAMSGDDIRIARGGFIMIHNTWVVTMGDRHALRETADWLEPFDTASVDIYAARSGLKPAEIEKMLDRETWIGGADAVDKGFADSLLDADSVQASARAAADMAPSLAAHQLDALLASAGMTRAKRRALIKQIKGGTPDAAAGGTHDAVPAGMQDAAVLAQVSDLLATVKTL